MLDHFSPEPLRNLQEARSSFMDLRYVQPNEARQNPLLPARPLNLTTHY